MSEDNNVDLLDRSVSPHPLSMHTTTRVVSFISKLKKKKGQEGTSRDINIEQEKEKELIKYKKEIDRSSKTVYSNQ